MAKLTTLADADHIMRHVSAARLLRDEHENILGFLPHAFELRPNEDSLSAAWVEYAEAGSLEENIRATLSAFGAVPDLKIRASARFALGNVGAIKATCSDRNQAVRISHEPIKGFDAHASVRQINTADQELLALLASETWAEMYEPV